MNNTGIYVRKLQDLHRDSIPGRWEESTLGKAPHKPLLLLCVTDLYRENSSRENRIEPTLCIEESFNEYWRVLFGSDNKHLCVTLFPFAARWVLVPGGRKRHQRRRSRNREDVCCAKKCCFVCYARCPTPLLAATSGVGAASPICNYLQQFCPGDSFSVHRSVSRELSLYPAVVPG